MFCFFNKKCVTIDKIIYEIFIVQSSFALEEWVKIAIINDITRVVVLDHGIYILTVFNMLNFSLIVPEVKVCVFYYANIRIISNSNYRRKAQIYNPQNYFNFCLYHT